MSAVPKLAAKVEKLSDAHEKAERRVGELAAKAEALSTFDDPADVSKLLAARSAVEGAKQERDALAESIGAARKAHENAVEEERREAEERRHAARLAAAGQNAPELLEALVTVALLAARNASLCDVLGKDRFRYHLADIVKEACKAACKDTDTSRPGAFRVLDVQLVVPMLAAE